jgi:hypothetical protein
MRRSVLLALLAVSLVLPLGTATARETRGTSTGLVIGYRAWGPLKLGMTGKEAQQTGVVSRKPDNCQGGFLLASPYDSRAHLIWTFTKGTFVVHRIVINGKADHTAKGIHPGSTLRRLRAKYPRLSKVKHSSAFEGGGTSSAKDIYAATVTRSYGSMTFQFAYGPRPGPGSPIDMIVVSKKPAVFFGC